MTVLGGIAEPHPRAVGQLHPPRPLDLHEEQLDRIVEIEQLEPAARERARLDFRAGVIRHQLVAVPAHHAAGVVVQRAQQIGFHLHDIVRAAVNGNLKLAGSLARAIHFGLVIAGGEAGLLLVDAIRGVVGLEEISRGLAADLVAKPQRDFASLIAGRFLAAGLEQHGKGGGVIVLGPARDVGEADGREPERRLVVHFALPKEERNRDNDCRQRRQELCEM